VIAGTVDTLSVHLAVLDASLARWADRDEPDAEARRAASDAVAAMDTMIAGLHQMRARLIAEIRRSDDAMLGGRP
jgi:hypothetical protein